MAQAIGGRLRPAARDAERICSRCVRGNETGAEPVPRFRAAVGREIEELTALGGPTRLRELGVPESEHRSYAECGSGPRRQSRNRAGDSGEIEARLQVRLVS